MPPKKYRVELSRKERTYLAELTTKGSCSARQNTRARILLKTDEGPHGEAWSDDLVSDALDVSPGTVANVRRRYARRGLEGAIRRKKPDRHYERKIDGDAEAQLLRLACMKPPKGRARWTLRLLADKMVELRACDSLSHETVRQVLKKTN